MKQTIKIQPTIFVILGMTGDLAERKIIPALFHLFEKKELPKRFHVVGFSRRALTQKQLVSFVGKVLKKHKGIRPSQSTLAKFTSLFSYQQGDFDDRGAYRELSRELAEIDDGWGLCTNKIFYLSVPPRFYKTILQNLERSNLTEPCSDQDGWTRVLLEKPFGKDLKSAQKLDRLLSKLFREQQIYRVDHYLGKEMIQSILAFRFSNSLFERTLNNKFIDSIEIRLWETLGVEDRINFYDGVGALRDVGQNHILQMLALATMDRVRGYTEPEVRNHRASLLRAVSPLSQKQIREFTYRAQYDGYKKSKGARPNSRTETYFKVVGFVNSPRWKGVPVVMESGKRLGQGRKEIVFNYKHPQDCICGMDPAHTDNKIVISMGAKQGIRIEFWTKKPGLKFELEKKTLDFDLGEQGKGFAEEYERLLLDAIRGDQTLFVSSDEERLAWKFIDPIVSAWEKNKVALKKYKPNTDEPIEGSMFINKSLGAKE